MVTKKISKFPPPPKLKLTLSVYNRVFFFNFDMACKCQRRPVALGDRIDTFCCFLHDMSFSCMDFQNPSWEFHDLISGFQNPYSEFHNTISKFHNASFTIRPASFRIQLQVSQSKFQNPFSTVRNPIAKFHNPTLTCSPRVSSRFPLNFLMVHCIFLQVPFSACSKFLQLLLQVSFHVSCAFVSQCLDAFLLQFVCGFLLVFLHGVF